MNPTIYELTRRSALETIDRWRQTGVEYASILDGRPRPWDPRPIAGISAEAALRGIQVFSLANADHVESILAAICQYVEGSLARSLAAAETLKLGTVLTRGGNA